MQRKKLLFFIPFLTKGGAENQALLLASMLKESYDIEFWALRNEGSLVPELEKLGIRWKTLGIDGRNFSSRWRLLKTLVKLLFEIRRSKFDVLFPFTYYPNVLCSAIWRYSGAKACYWNQRGMETQLPVSALEKRAIAAGPGYIANATVCKEYLARRHNISTGKITVIPNGVIKNEDRLNKEEWRKRLKIQDDAFCVVMAANYFPEKDHATVLKAWKDFTLKNTFKSPPLLVFSGSSHVSDPIKMVKSLAWDLQLNSSVCFLEENDDLAGLIEGADVCLLSSRSEGCPNSILEYMYHSKAVIATDIPAVTEVFGNSNPYLFAVEDAEGLSDLLQRAYEQPAELATLGAANRALVLQNYGPEQMTAKYLDLLKNLTSDGV